jgi:hypothetical protein
MSLDLPTDLFSLGRNALTMMRAAQDGRGFFEGAQRLCADGTWQGPDGATVKVVDETDLEGLGGLTAIRSAGVNLLLLSPHSRLADEAEGLRLWLRIPYRTGEPTDERTLHLDQATNLLAQHPTIEALLPTPVGEPQGLDTLEFFAACRGRFPSGHVVVDLALLGHKLGQLCLTFGADELFGPIGKARLLRLGEHAHQHDITSQEAAALIAAVGLLPCPRNADGTVATS